ncbi:aegerolysin family protein [Actinophytocola glycyrrhizae]|uniref:Aegerolysin family protein n=1 Tax=Actinophytocola glycyrrhizae TaxID=2044873 RepID=A0ABV9RWF1_9PSEU
MAAAVAAAACVIPVTTASATPAEQRTHQHDVQPRTENLQFHLWLTNLNNDWLNVEYANNNWGKWCDSDGQQPEAPKPVPPNADEFKAFCSQGRQNSPSGTEGEVRYVFRNDPNKWFKIYWSVPWGSSTNTMNIDSAKKVFIQCNGFAGSGKVEKVTCKVGALP